MEWINNILQSSEFGLAILPASFVLGLITAVGSWCNLGFIAAVAGYAGSRTDTGHRRDTWLIAGCFFIGTIVSLAALGLLVGYFGQLAGDNFGRYGQGIAGFTAVFFGLFALDLVPFKLPSINLARYQQRTGLLGAVVFGLVIGAASITCTLACGGPLLPLVLGVAAVRGQVGWGALILTVFAIGYSLPLATIILGVGLGRMTTLAQKAIKPIRIIAGIALLGAGFYLLATL